MRTIDLSPLYRSFIGSDRLASLVDAASRTDNQNAYPPYNIELLGEDKYRISMAVAGFASEDVDIVAENNVLSVNGKKTDDDKKTNTQFLHKGISERSFQRKFQLGDHVKVTGANMEHGLLHIDLARVVPEAKKPRRIDIGGNTGNQG